MKTSTLRISLGADPMVIDPQMAETGIAVMLAEQVTSTLLEVDASLKIQNKDAERLGWENGGRRLHISLKKGLLWSDEKPVQACQYKDGILRALNPEILAPYADLFFEIKGAESAKKGQAKLDTVGLKCNNQEGSLDFEILRPYSSKILYALSFVASAPARIDLMANADSSWLLPRGNTPGVSNGPFLVLSWKRDRRIVLQKRNFAPSYDQAKISRIEMPIVRDANTAFTMYESNELDILDEVPPSQLQSLLHRKDRHTAPWLTTYMVGFSFKANPLIKNINVRKALAAVAHQEEIPLLLPSGEEGARGWVPPALIPSNYRLQKSLFDPAAGKKYLSGIKFSTQKPFQIFFNSGERHKLLMERLAHNFNEHLGLKVELHPIEWKVLLSTLKFKAPDMYRYAWTAVYPDVLFFLELFHSKNINNFGGYKNSEYDKLVEELGRVDLTKRNDVFWKKVQRCQAILVLEDPALIPIYHYAKNTLIKEKIKGLEVSARGLGPLKNAYYESIF